jgi:riboflavin biosynthesis pyrimidine reductase
MIASVDGAAQADGRAGGLSAPADERLFALLRAHADVLLVGASTVRAEHYGGARPTPAARAWRLDHGLSDAPVIAVVTANCAFDPAGRLFTDTVVRPLVLTCHSAPPERVAALSAVADVVLAGDRCVDIAAALDVLAGRGLRRVSCEGGPNLLAQVTATGRLDELSLTISPLLLAGAALRILAGPPLTVPARLQLAHVLEDDGYLFLRYLRDARLDSPQERAGDAGSPPPSTIAAQ